MQNKTTFNHVLDIAFTVETPELDWTKIPGTVILDAIQKRIDGLRSNPQEVLEAVDSAQDVYCVQRPFLALSPTEDWPEDFGMENGCYQNTCQHCGHTFNGLCGRPLCKWCHGISVSNSDEKQKA